VPREEAMMGLLNDATSLGVTLARLGRGIYSAVGAADRPAPRRLLELYEFEACPYCRKVREVLSELDLDYLCHPVAHGSPRRSELLKLGGKVQAPYLVDPNTGSAMYESADIIDYLNETYGDGKRAGWSLPVPDFVDNVVSGLAGAVRITHGGRIRVPARHVKLAPLTLYNMEGSPYCRKVREALAELDLEYVVRNLPKGSAKRQDLVERGGKMQVPYLIDPNTDTEMYESDDIVAYLREGYGSHEMPENARDPAHSARGAHGKRRAKRAS
jgi:glutathione S-transferase